MDIWSKARSFAQEAAKRSQELTMEAAKRSQEFTIAGSRLTDIVSEASKRSLEFAAEASKHADLIKSEALKRADQIKSLSIVDSSSSSAPDPPPGPSLEELELFGITDELREFVNEIKITTFQEFPLPDDSSISDVPTVSNVRQDLSEWQAKHASLVLSTVKEISKLRYELCPRFMKDRQFWRIYFLLVNNHIAPYEKQYMEKLKLKEEKEKAKETPKSEAVCGSDGTGISQPLKTKTSSAEQDLDAFLLGDLGDDDNGPDDGDDGDDDGFDDDFDKIDDNSEDENTKDSKQK